MQAMLLTLIDELRDGLLIVDTLNETRRLDPGSVDSFVAFARDCLARMEAVAADAAPAPGPETVTLPVKTLADIAREARAARRDGRAALTLVEGGRP